MSFNNNTKDETTTTRVVVTRVGVNAKMKKFVFDLNTFLDCRTSV